MRWAKFDDGRGETRLLNLSQIAGVFDRTDGGQDIMQVRNGSLVTVVGSAPGKRLLDKAPGFVPGRLWLTRFEGGPIDFVVEGLVNAETVLEVVDRGKARSVTFDRGFVAWTDITVEAFEGAGTFGSV